MLGRLGKGGFAAACAMAAVAARAALAAGGAFSIAVVPDTQNMIDYKHQRASGFPYSPHYKAFSDELASYAAWYKAHEAPGESDQAFAAKDAFHVTLSDFRARFGAPR